MKKKSIRLSTRYRVVIDTNVFTSAYLWGGVPAKVVDLWLTEQVQLITSPYLISEISLVLERFNYQREEISKLKDILSAFAEYPDCKVGDECDLFCRNEEKSPASADFAARRKASG